MFLTRGSPASPAGGVGNRSRLAWPRQQFGERGTQRTPTGAADRGHDPARVRGHLGRHGDDVRHREPSFSLQNNITFTLATGAGTANETNDSCINTLTLAR